jgi:protein-tyrosine-phosphatase
VLREAFDLTVGDQRPKHLTTLANRRFDHVITLCDKARETVPDFADARRAHWSVPDPADGDYEHFRETAREIDTRVRHLLPALEA